jgi:hypothetical protein
VPLRLKATVWAISFSIREAGILQTQVGASASGPPNKNHTGRRADRDSWLAGSLLSSWVRGSGRQRATPAPGEQGVQFTAPSQDLHVANRDLGTVEHVNSNGDFRIRIDSGQEVRFNVREHPHLDYGYAVTSHSSQGQTADRVLVRESTWTPTKESCWSTTASRTYPFRGLNTMPTSTQMTGASFPVVSVARVLKLQQRRWSSGLLYRRQN